MVRTLIAAVCLVPSVAMAEGARQHFSCQILTACDAAGICQPADEAWSFTIEPIEVGPKGEGVYHLVYGETLTQTAVRTDLTMIWTDEDWTFREFIFTGKDTAMRISRALGPGDAKTLAEFMTCEGPT